MVRGEALAATGADVLRASPSCRRGSASDPRDHAADRGRTGQLTGQVADFAKHRSEEEVAGSLQAMASSEQIGLTVGGCAVLVLIGSWLMSFLTIARPIRALTVAMDKLAGGDFSVVLPGLGRKDEVGGVAAAVEKFKVVSEQKAREEAEAKTRQDQAAAAQRKAEMHKLADGFEAAIGEIVDTVSSAATELEASASTLTSTAERAQGLATMVAAASEEASTNVQSVASATEELSSSITEIGRQVQESARVASEAVEPGPYHHRPRQRVVPGGDADRRRRRADQHHRRPDQPAGAQRHHRGGARRRSRPRLCRGGLRGQGAGRADREGDRRDRPADRQHPDCDANIRSARSRTSATPSRNCRRSPRPSRLPSKSRARRRRKSPATCSRRRKAPTRCRPTSPRCSAARARPARRPRRCCRLRRCCPATVTASSSRSASSWVPFALPDRYRSGSSAPCATLRAQKLRVSTAIVVKGTGKILHEGHGNSAA